MENNNQRQYIVCFGAPFEQQSFYGPFDNFEEASEYADKYDEYSWIVTLNSPEK